ncbi:MAG: hypothetical protein IKE43_10710 [Coriobacteriales bacterium]|nr:hypothetical protein [Coriobacteriales bacterium]
METGGMALLLSILLALILALGSCTGIDTSQIEEAADDLGIAPAELSDIFGDLGGGFDYDGYSLYSDDSDDDIFGDYETETETADSAQEAAEGAGFESFVAPGDFDLSLGESSSAHYFYQDGLASGIFFYDELVVFIDKADLGSVDAITDTDDREFSLEWSQTISGFQIKCFGYDKESVCKATFTDGDYYYMIDAMASDDDLESGLSIADLTAIINALTK